MVKMSQCVLQDLYGPFSDHVGASDVTEFEKGMEAAHHITGNMALDGQQVNLHHR